MTVFNGRTDKETRRKKYIPTVITGVSYAEAKGATVANNGVWSDNVQYKIRIPMKAAVQYHTDRADILQAGMVFRHGEGQDGNV